MLFKRKDIYWHFLWSLNLLVPSVRYRWWPFNGILM